MTDIKPGEQRKAKSPYKRHNKTPYRYSDLYQRWRQAVRDGKSNEARHLSQLHSQRFFGRFTPAELAARGNDPLTVWPVGERAA